MDIKKIGILTFYNACNYGAFLQTIALKSKIEEYPKTEVYIIKYKNKNISDNYSIINLSCLKNGFKSTFLRAVRIKDIVKRNMIFKRNQNKSFKFIKFNDNKAIQELHKVVVGSDQVWNLYLTNQDETYFLEFIEPYKRVSYAASVGWINKDFNIELFGRYLPDFSAISVREKELYDELMNKLRLKNIELCVDPVFLLTKDNWQKYGGMVRVINEPYILIFIMGVTKQADFIVNEAIEMGKSLQSRVILLGDQERWYKYRKTEHFGVATPKEFVNLINNARCVFTNSFHATSFSIILNTPFYVELNIKNSDRLTSLLELTGLKNRGMYDGRFNGDYSEAINWSKVDTRLEPEISRSFNYIKKYITEH